MTDDKQGQDINREQPCTQQRCPVASLISMVGECFDKQSDAYKHFTKSRLEMLKGVRSLVDKKISDLEENLSPQQPKKATKITVE